MTRLGVNVSLLGVRIVVSCVTFDVWGELCVLVEEMLRAGVRLGRGLGT